MVDTLVLGASAARHEGSSPFRGTIEKDLEIIRVFFYWGTMGLAVVTGVEIDVWDVSLPSCELGCIKILRFCHC